MVFKNEHVVIVVLILLCVMLLVGVIGMGIYIYKKQERRALPEVVVIHKENKAVGGTNTDLPIYPRQDPKYPLRHVQSAEFQQVGTLTYDESDEPIVLPLFGRPMPTRNDRWEYYTATDKQYMLKIPIMFENKDCLEEIGCREVYTKDTVFIPAYKKEFKVNLYKYRDTSYIPN